MQKLLLVAIAVMAVGVHIGSCTQYPRDYKCGICLEILRSFHRGNLPLEEACQRQGSDACAVFNEAIAHLQEPLRPDEDTDLKAQCQVLSQCPKTEAYLEYLKTHGHSAASPLDLRVTPGNGARAYGYVRVSVVTPAAQGNPDPKYFDYSKPFRYRWTHNHLSSKLQPITPGPAGLNLTIGATKVNIRLPTLGAGTTGIIIADPCFHGSVVGCTYGDQFKTFERLTGLLNAASLHNDFHYWMILGDNFYDRLGTETQTFFDQLTLATKTRIFATIPGNHDYWANGAPGKQVPNDQFGNGHMQFYAMDAHAALKNATEFLDFSVDPDKSTNPELRIASQDNFQSYFLIGDTAFILYSGGYHFASAKPFFTEACAWVGKINPASTWIAGHWNEVNDGCEAEMSVPAVFKELSLLPGCAAQAKRNTLKYAMGHVHSNEVTLKNTGFMLGGMGMEGEGKFGLPVLTTLGGRIELLYYPLADKSGMDKYTETHTCISSYGLNACKHLAQVWLNQTIVHYD